MNRLLKSVLVALLVLAPVYAYSAEAGTKSDAQVVFVAKVDAAPAPVAAVAPAPILEKKADAPIAAPSESINWWKVGLKNVLELVFLVLCLMATALVRVMMRKYGFEEQSGKVNDVLTKAIGFAEQWSIKKMKMEGEAAPGGAKKMEMAVDFAKKLAGEYKLPDKGTDWWEHKLEGWLGVDKAKASASKG